MPENKCMVRFMKESDVSHIAELERECFSSPWSEKTLRESLGNPNYTFMVAEAEGRPVGYAGLIKAGDEADITNVAVTSLYRRNGIALSILKEILDLAGKNKIKKIFLEVRESNEPAKNLYERLGFVKTGLRKNFYAFPTENAILMEAEI